MKLPGHIAKRVRALLEEVAVDGGLWSVSPAAAKKEAGKLLPYFQGTRRKPPSKKLPELRRHEVGNDRLASMVATRAGGLCELAPKITHIGREPHHLLSGSAKRIDEKPENVMWACRVHHDAYHHRPSAFIAVVKDWCTKHGYPVPARVLRLEQRTAEGMRLKAAPKALNSLAIKDTQS